MNGARHLALAALVTATERRHVDAAATLVAQILGEADGATWTCACTFADDSAALARRALPALAIRSLSVDVDGLDEPWPQVEERLRRECAVLAAGGDALLLCTVFRHVADDGDPELAQRKRIRIRRLNLLAATISHATGAYVIDVDRTLADLGARQLQTDYRLTGDAVAPVVAATVASSIILNALDDLVSERVLGAALQIAPQRTAIAQLPERARETPRIAIGSGRRKQLVAPAYEHDEQRRVTWLIAQTLAGRLGPRAALQKFGAAVRKRGLRESGALLVSGFARLLGRAG